MELPGIEPVLDWQKCRLTFAYATCGSRWLRDLPGDSAGDVGGANTRTRRTTQAKLVCEKHAVEGMSPLSRLNPSDSPAGEGENPS